MSAKIFCITTVVLIGMCVLVAGCGDDTVAPNTSNEAPILPPQNVNIVQKLNGNVLISWNLSSQPNLRGYNVYRLDEGSSAIQLLTASPITDNNYEDVTTSLGHSYEYRVTTVGSKGQESNFSAVTITLTPLGTGNHKQNRDG